MKWKWYVYILECNDSSFYVGRTWKPEGRFEQHLSGLGGKYTAKHGVKRLAYLEEYESFNEASQREHQLHSWNRLNKLNLINGVWNKP